MSGLEKLQKEIEWLEVDIELYGRYYQQHIDRLKDIYDEILEELSLVSI
jgi:hypothetical protein